MATLNLFPARIRFTNTDGTLTPEAYRALQVLFERVGGPLGDNGADTFGDLTGVASLDMSLTDTVTQPETPDIAHDSVSQSPSHERQALSDVMQAAAFDVLMPDVVQPANEAAAFDLATAINAATSKTTPVDADVLPLADSASGFSLKKLSWANLKAAIKTYLSGDSFPIGSTTPAPGAFTTVSANGKISQTSSGVTEQIKLSSSGGYVGFYKNDTTTLTAYIQNDVTNSRLTIAVDGGNTLIANYIGATKVTEVSASGFSVAGMFSATGPVSIGAYTLATRPAHAVGMMIYVSDGGAGANFQGSNGGAWVNLG